MSSNLSLESFAERLTAVMPVMCKSMLRYEQNALTSGTLSLPQFWAMGWMRERGEATMHELSEAMQMKPSTATMLVDRMVRLKLAARRRNVDDRRKVHVRLTRAGERMLDDMRDQKKRALTETFRHMQPRERAQYLQLIETLADRLKAELSSNTQGKCP